MGRQGSKRQERTTLTITSTTQSRECALLEGVVSANIDVSRLPHRCELFKRTPDDCVHNSLVVSAGVNFDGWRLDGARPVIDSHTGPCCGRSGTADRCGRMRPTGTSEAALVVAAQAGDRDAVDELVTSYLPLVYNVVGRAVGTRSDVDDIV